MYRLLPVLLVASVLIAAAPAEAIVGGKPAAPGRWPWMVAVLDADVRDAGWAQFCGGVVIAPRRVLTTGHCVVNRRPRDIEVMIGRTRLSQPGGRRLRVKSISVFPGYANGRTRGLDAGVLTLAADAGVAPLALAQPGQEGAWAAGTLAWTVGWGRLTARKSRGGNHYWADRLRELQLPLQGDDACEGAYGLGWDDLPYRPQWQLCAGTGTGESGSCYGDSGGPLVVAMPDGSWLDVGIHVTSDSCAPLGYFDLATRVDQVSAFALGAKLTAQPNPVARPRIAGRLARGKRLRCTPGRWRGADVVLSFRWKRPSARPRHVVGRGRVHRASRRDVARGLRCLVTGANRGGRVTVASRPLRRR